MRNNIFKPLILFIVFIFSVSALIIYTKGIKVPSFSDPKKNEQKSSFSGDNIRVVGKKMTISYGDFDIFIKSCCGAVVHDVVSGQDGNTIKVAGKASFPFSATFEGKLEPSAENERIAVKIVSLTLGKVNMPESLAKELEKQIQRELDDKINKQYKVKYAKITSKGLEIETQ